MDQQPNHVERRESDRRREHRYELAGRICWGRPEVGESHAGWLSDASDRSVSFITASGSKPKFGEEVELNTGLAWAPPRGRVERIAPYDEHLCLVACRRIN